MEEKQKEAINLYVNFVSLLNSQRDIIINKINSYPPNHFDNELNNTLEKGKVVKRPSMIVTGLAIQITSLIYLIGLIPSFFSEAHSKKIYLTGKS